MSLKQRCGNSIGCVGSREGKCSGDFCNTCLSSPQTAELFMRSTLSSEPPSSTRQYVGGVGGAVLHSSSPSKLPSPLPVGCTIGVPPGPSSPTESQRKNLTPEADAVSLPFDGKNGGRKDAHPPGFINREGNLDREVPPCPLARYNHFGVLPLPYVKMRSAVYPTFDCGRRGECTSIGMATWIWSGSNFSNIFCFALPIS